MACQDEEQVTESVDIAKQLSAKGLLCAKCNERAFCATTNAARNVKPRRAFATAW